VGPIARVIGFVKSEVNVKEGPAPGDVSRLAVPVKVRGFILYKETPPAQGRVALYCVKEAPKLPPPELVLRANTKGAAAPDCSRTCTAFSGVYTRVAGDVRAREQLNMRRRKSIREDGDGEIEKSILISLE